MQSQKQDYTRKISLRARDKAPLDKIAEKIYTQKATPADNDTVFISRWHKCIQQALLVSILYITHQ